GVRRQFASHTRLPFRWQGVPGNRSQGRNAAIRLADTDLIAVTDVNIVEPEWFERIIAPLECGKADVVGGWYEPLGDTPRESALGAMTLFSLRDIRPDSFVPASRSVAFTREAWRRVGGYDERLATAEDTVLAFAMRRAGLRFMFEPRAVVRCWTATSVVEAVRMYRRYAFSDGRAGTLGMRQTHYGRIYAAYGIAAGVRGRGVWWPPAGVALVGGGVPYAVVGVRAVVRLGLWTQVAYLIPVGLAVGVAPLGGEAAGRVPALPAVPFDRTARAIR